MKTFMKKRIYGLILCFAAIVFAVGLWLSGKNVVPVLMYHNIGYPKTDRARINTVSPEAFERQMAFIKNNGYRILSVDEYVSIIRTRQKVSSKCVLVTFDDGLLNNYTIAYPILKKYSIPAVMFIPSGLVGKIDPGDGVFQMNGDQLREMADNGITIGSHTVRHIYLPDLSTDSARREIVESKLVLEKMLGRPINFFAYPSGGFTNEIKTMLKEAGYKAAFTTNRGMDRFNHDLFELRRIRPKDGDGWFVLWMKLSGYYNLIRDSQKGS